MVELITWRWRATLTQRPLDGWGSLCSARCLAPDMSRQVVVRPTIRGTSTCNSRLPPAETEAANGTGRLAGDAAASVIGARSVQRPGCLAQLKWPSWMQCKAGQRPIAAAAGRQRLWPRGGPIWRARRARACAFRLHSRGTSGRLTLLLSSWCIDLV